MNSDFFNNIKSKLDSIVLTENDAETVVGEDIIRINVPAFLRILELVREDIGSDVPLHYLTEILIRLSKGGAVTMEDYKTIYNYTMQDSRQSADTTNDLDEVAGPDKCWDGYKIGNPKTKEGTGKNKGKRVNNCVPEAKDK